MLPNFGCNLRKFIFQPLDETTFEEIKEEILTSIENYTRGVEVLKLRIQEDNEARANDLNSLRISLLVKIKEIENAITEVEVSI